MRVQGRHVKWQTMTYPRRIDGVLRMEAGFEITLCKFERDSAPVRIKQVQTRVQRLETQPNKASGRLGDRASPREDNRK